MIKTSYLAALLITCVMLSSPVEADPFRKGSQALSIVAGSGSAFNENYIILGAGYGYYIVDGLELGIDAQFWRNADPKITKVSPQVRYVFTRPKQFKPYIGAFYRRTYTDGLEDLDSVGYRVGLMFMGQGNMYFGAGVVYEDYRDCNESIFRDCSSSYPEILFSFSM